MLQQKKEFRVELKTEKDLLKWLEKNQNLLQAKVIRLHGDMGAGKTTLVRLYLSLIAPENEDGTSPTFAVHHQYKTKSVVVDHLDLFRLEGIEDLEQVGFWEILKNTQMAFIEWPEKVPETLWPKNHTYMDLYLEVKSSSRFLFWFSL